MVRFLISIAFVTVALAPQPEPAQAKGVRTLSTVERVGRSDIVVLGKVTGFEKETMDALPFVQAKEKVPHKVAVIEIQKRLVGAEGLTHVKAAFVEPPKPVDPTIQPRPGVPRRIDLRQGQEGIFFLIKHSSGEFYTIPNLLPPLDSTAANYKALSEIAVKTASVLADPTKSLKAESAEERFFAVTALILHYRGLPVDGRDPEQTPIAADESRLILKALAEQDWRYRQRKLETEPYDPWMLYTAIGLTEKDGWARPQAVAGGDLRVMTKEAFVQWLDGPGKDYRLMKRTPKKSLESPTSP